MRRAAPHHVAVRLEDVRRGHADAQLIQGVLSRILEEKGFIRHEEDGVRYVFRPIVPRENAGRSALRHLMDTFFDGSAERMVATLLDGESARLSDKELERLSRLVSEARKEGRKK